MLRFRSLRAPKDSSVESLNFCISWFQVRKFQPIGYQQVIYRSIYLQVSTNFNFSSFRFSTLCRALDSTKFDKSKPLKATQLSNFQSQWKKLLKRRITLFLNKAMLWGNLFQSCSGALKQPVPNLFRVSETQSLALNALLHWVGFMLLEPLRDHQ